MTQEVESARTNPHWYREAIIYQAHVRAFLDSTSDGVGDFPGLTSRLGYLEDLGIDTLWLLPFYPSPLKDDGYDIADYENIHPAYGTMDDFDRFIEEAHRRRIRVITELVINHTSDQHPWFQAARRAPAGSPARDFYVWSHTNLKYQGVPIIFSDTETSNWTWDDAAGAYYWHRFFPPSAGSELRQSRRSRRGRAGDALLARSWCRRHAARCRALPDRARRHAVREPR